MRTITAFVASIIFVGSLSAPLSTSALTQQEKTSLILQLVQKVLELQQQIVALGGAPITIPPGLATVAQGNTNSAGAAASSCTVERTLALGMKGDDVKCLQAYLVAQNLLTPDSATGYFGPLTRAAVIALQQQHDLEQVGHVGRLTRGIVNTAHTSQPSTPPIASAPATPAGRSAATPAPTDTLSQTACLVCNTFDDDELSCTQDGVTVPHDSSRTFYSTSIVIYPATCTSVSQVRTCSYGTLSGSSQYNKASCSVKDATAPSVPANLSATAVSSTQINLSWTASTDQGGSGLAGYKIYRANIQISTTTATSFQNTGLAPSTSYTYHIAAYDNAGNVSAKSTSVTKMTLAAPVATTSPDKTSPLVSITAPTANSTVSGAVAFVATATDNVGVVGVQFKIDGSNYGPERTTSPYVIPWVTASTTNGVHTVDAVARDAAGNRATSTITVLVANPSGFHCYSTNGIRICRNAANEATYLSVPNANVAYNIHTVRDGNTYYTIYHSEHKGAVPPEGGDSIQSGFTTGTYTGLMPAHDFRIWGNDTVDSTLAWYSIDASGNRISGPGGGGNPIAISGLQGDPYFYVFFLGVADDDRDRLRAESDWRHYLIQARTQNFITYDLKTDSGWKPFSSSTANTIRPAILTDAAGAALRSNAPKALGATQGLIGSIAYVNGVYHFFYGDYASDGVSYNIYHRTTTNLATGTWSAPEVLFARGADPKNRTMVRIAKAEGLDRWLVLYGCYVTIPDGTQRQDMCLQYTNNLAIIGTGGLSSLSLTSSFALGFSDLASRSLAQPNLLTDRWGNQTHVNDAVNTGEFYWSDFNPSQCSADPRPGCPVYGGDVLRGGWNVKVM